MIRALFRLSSQQIVWLTVVGLASIAYALHLRYQVIEQPAIGLTCEAGVSSWLCISRKTAIWLYNWNVFGQIALIAALLNLARPSIVLWTIASIAATAGLVLYNAALSALAMALLTLSLARAAPESE